MGEARAPEASCVGIASHNMTDQAGLLFGLLLGSMHAATETVIDGEQQPKRQDRSQDRMYWQDIAQHARKLAGSFCRTA